VQTKIFQFSEEDLIGEETLEAMGLANKFNRWMYQTIKPWCKGKIMEIGSGAGNISQFFIGDELPITLTDIRESYCQKLHKKFAANQSLLGIEKLNLVDPHFEKKHKHLLNSFDTVFALNVVEHIEDDSLAVSNCKKLLKKGGHLIILVPSYELLYNGFDRGLGHYRRYNRSTLSQLFIRHNFAILKKQHFNFAGIFGWFVSGTLLRKKIIPTGQMKVYNLLVPLFKITDKLVFNTIGLSTIVVGKKQ
jgi:2-polyprenyl-3-methyl-5-hydroxy-6-metoxy-1,4-benzoquinol methylase